MAESSRSVFPLLSIIVGSLIGVKFTFQCGIKGPSSMDVSGGFPENFLPGR